MDLVNNFLSAPIASTIFVITIITSIQAFQNQNLRDRFLFIPYRVKHNKEYERIFTSGLIHADYGHLGFNMFTYFMFAFHLERFIGHWQFAILYVLALLISDISALIKHQDSPHYRSLGASGAVSAVIFAMILIQPGMRLSLLFIPIYIPGWIFGILYLMYSQYAAKKGNDNIGHEAHMWGGIGGLLLSIPILAFNGTLDYVLEQWQNYFSNLF